MALRSSSGEPSDGPLSAETTDGFVRLCRAVCWAAIGTFGPHSGQPRHLALQDDVADEGAGVDERVGDHQAQETALTLEHGAEHEAHHEIAGESAEPLVEV